MIRRPPRSPLFPYPPLFRSAGPPENSPPQAVPPQAEHGAWIEATAQTALLRFSTAGSVDDGKSTLIGRLLYDSKGDRKSTRLNSSHSQISYAVFCLKKKR